MKGKPMQRSFRHSRIICFCFIIAGLCIATAVQAAHTPEFSWRVTGDANYEQWIYDGDDPIALFEMQTLDEPMQALMMFRLVPKPLLLRHLKLTPGGKPLVSAVQLYWKTGRTVTDVLERLEVTGEGTDRLTVVFGVRDAHNTLRVTRTLTVSYDNMIGGYVYDFNDVAEILAPESLDTNGSVRFEYCDPWFTGSPAPSQRFPGMWKGRYRQFAYESADGSILSVPHHHVSNSQKGGIRLRRDGVFAAVFEEDGNPAIRFHGDTADKTAISICPWAYDVHFGLQVDSKDIYKPIRTHFSIFQCPLDKARDMDERAVPPPLNPTEWQGLRDLPVYEPVSSFETSLSMERPRAGDLDPWFWRPQDEPGAVWDTASGRTGSRSLKISKETDGISTWYSMCEGQGYWSMPWTPCKGYEVSCWVKTENLRGPGASIGISYHVPNVPPAWPVTRSERLTGTNGWT
jgi:hypothetical protein